MPRSPLKPGVRRKRLQSAFKQTIIACLSEKYESTLSFVLKNRKDKKIQKKLSETTARIFIHEKLVFSYEYTGSAEKTNRITAAAAFFKKIQKTNPNASLAKELKNSIYSDVSPKSVRNRLTGHRQGYVSCPTWLSDDEEEELVVAIRIATRMCQPVTQKECFQLVKWYLDKKRKFSGELTKFSQKVGEKCNMPGYDWFENFSIRKGIKLRNPEGVCERRVKIDATNFKKWVDMASTILFHSRNAPKIPPSRIANLDETNCVMDNDPKASKV